MPKKVIRQEHYSMIKELKGRGISNREIGRELGVSEGTVRYWEKAGYRPGEVKAGRGSKAEKYRDEIERWMREREIRSKRVVIKNLYRELKGKGYEGSYRWMVRYIRKKYPGIKKKKGKVRLETMPGFLMQIDWHEDGGKAVAWATIGTCPWRFSFFQMRIERDFQMSVISLSLDVSPPVQVLALEVALHQLAFYEEVLHQHHA